MRGEDLLSWLSDFSNRQFLYCAFSAFPMCCNKIQCDLHAFPPPQSPGEKVGYGAFQPILIQMLRISADTGISICATLQKKNRAPDQSKNL